MLDGYNVCIFAYGQTGSGEDIIIATAVVFYDYNRVCRFRVHNSLLGTSMTALNHVPLFYFNKTVIPNFLKGKTWTMSGPPNDRGVNTRALGELFERTQARSSTTRNSITVSLLEVYNEDIRDLLVAGGSTEKLEVRQGDQGIHVPGLTIMAVEDIQVRVPFICSILFLSVLLCSPICSVFSLKIKKLYCLVLSSFISSYFILSFLFLSYLFLSLLHPFQLLLLSDCLDPFSNFFHSFNSKLSSVSLLLIDSIVI